MIRVYRHVSQDVRPFNGKSLQHLRVREPAACALERLQRGVAAPHERGECAGADACSSASGERPATSTCLAGRPPHEAFDVARDRVEAARTDFAWIDRIAPVKISRSSTCSTPPRNTGPASPRNVSGVRDAPATSGARARRAIVPRICRSRRRPTSFRAEEGE